MLYFNQAHRWNWGIVAGQVPYFSGGFQSELATVGGVPAQVDQTILFRQTEQSAAGIVAYPFNRSQRVEVQGGVTRIVVRSDRRDDGVLAEHRAADRARLE